MENLLFLALVAVVGIIRWIAQAAENKRNAEAARREDGEPAAPIQRAPADSEEERIRRFMEALGVPKDAAPPPRKVAPRPPKKIMPVDPFPMPQGRVEPPPLPSPTEVYIPELPREPERPPATLPLPVPQTSMLAPVQREPAPVPEFGVEEDTRHTLETATVASALLPTGGHVPAGSRPGGGVVARLATAEGLRDAMVLREIFGPPRSMQSFDPARAS